MLKDAPMALAKSILDDENYYRFAVLTDPVQRLLSLYLNYFLDGVGGAPLPKKLANFVAGHQGRENIDPGRGISFRTFVSYIVERDVKNQEPGARPQHLFIPEAGRISRFYREDQLGQLQQDLLLLRDLKVNITAGPGDIRNPVCERDSGDRGAGGKWADTLPSELPTGLVVASYDYVDGQIRERIESYYREDYRLYNSTFEPEREAGTQ
jgi:hypothetical protein